jgi:tetratricopeptide (TPR) repeat protein
MCRPVDRVVLLRYRRRKTSSMNTSALNAPIPEIKSRVSVFCARLVEACWLLAVALVPVLHDPCVLPSFPPIKITVVRSLGMLVTAALLVSGMEALFQRHSARLLPAAPGVRSWLFGGVLLFISCGVATLFSVDRGISIWGMPWNLQGTITFSCQLALGFGVAAFLRTRVQLERLVTVALAASAPIAIYGILQRFGVDPLFGFFGQPSASLAGYPTVLGGYILMLLPLSAYRLWFELTQRDAKAGSKGRWMPFACYAMLLALQVAALVAADKRGPFVAFAAAVVAAFLLVGARTSHLRLAKWGICVATVFALLLLSLAAFKKAGVLGKEVPVLGTLSGIIPLGKKAGVETGDDYRRRMWAKAPEIVMGIKPFVFPEGNADRHHFLRPWIGYGPETLQGILSQHWPFAGDGPGVSMIENRFHNYFWDTWESMGLFGLGALVWLYLSAFRLGFERTGLISGSSRESIQLVTTTCVGGVLGGALAAVTYGAGYFGVGFQFGFVTGVVAVPLRLRWRTSVQSAPRQDLAGDLLIIAILVSLLGHWVDMAFVFPAGNTAALFWVFLGAVVGMSRCGAQERSADPRDSAQTDSAPWVQSGLLASLLAGIILIGIIHGSVEGASVGKLGAGDILRSSLIESKFRNGPGHQISAFLLPSWILINVYLSLGIRFARFGDRWRALCLAGGVSLLLGGAYAWLKAGCLASLGPIPAVFGPTGAAVAFAAGSGAISVGFLFLCVLLSIAVAIALFSQRDETQFARVTWLERGTALLVGIAAVAVIWFGSAYALRSGAATHWATLFESKDRKAAAIAVYQYSLKFYPYGSWERNSCADLIVELGERETSDENFAAAMGRSISLLVEGQKFTQLNPGNFHIGQVYLRWALRTIDQNARKTLLLQARNALQRATTFAPNTEAAWFEASLVDRELGDSASANQKLARADLVGEEVDPSVWARLYASRSLTNRAPALKQAFTRRALMYVTRAVDSSTESMQKNNEGIKEIRQKTYPLLVDQGTYHFNLGEYEAALECFRKATEAGPESNLWRAEAMMANTYAALGNPVEALSSVDNALKDAPPEMRRDLLLLKQSLLGGQLVH